MGMVSNLFFSVVPSLMYLLHKSIKIDHANRLLRILSVKRLYFQFRLRIDDFELGPQIVEFEFRLRIDYF